MSEPDPKRVRAGKLSRRKGKVFERLVCKMFRDAGFSAERSQQYKGNTDSADIAVKELPGWHFECKHSKVVQLAKWCAQADRDAGLKHWAVVYKQDRCDAVLVTRIGSLPMDRLVRFSVDKILGIMHIPLVFALLVLADIHGIKSAPV